MTASVSQTITLEEFLKLPNIEDSPSWEYTYGVVIQKPISKFRHSIIQKRLLRTVDDNSNEYTALPELRCTFAGRSVVPDVAVVAWNRIKFNEIGEPVDNFEQPPDWTIEILSPKQSPNRVIRNIMFSIQNGTKLGWFLDSEDESIMVFQPNQVPEIKQGDDVLPVLDVLKGWGLSVADIFNCMNFS